MSTLPKHYLTPDEYLEIDRQAERKSEYFAGEMFAMAGARAPHTLIVTNLTIDLGTQIRGRPCQLHGTHMRVQITPTGLYTYPDVVVVCGEPQFRDQRQDALLNPALIVEVLSESTEAYDRGKKLQDYETLESLTAYLLVSTDRVNVELFQRVERGPWTVSRATRLQDSLELTAIACHLTLSSVYDKVNVPEEPYPRISSQARAT